MFERCGCFGFLSICQSVNLSISSICHGTREGAKKEGARDFNKQEQGGSMTNNLAGESHFTAPSVCVSA